MPDVYVAPTENKQETTISSEPVVPVEEVPKKVDKKAEETVKRKDMIQQVLERSGECKHNLIWGSYMVYPEKRFISQQDDEETVLLLRAHPITNARWVIMVAFMLIIPELLTMTGLLDVVPLKYIFLAKMIWFLVAMGIAFEKFLNWYYTVFIVTNERIVDIDFENLLYRVVSYANLNHIEEPSMVAGGFVRSIFHYGDVFVATAAEQGAIEGLGVPYPDRVIRIISELSEELEKSRIHTDPK